MILISDQTIINFQGLEEELNRVRNQLAETENREITLKGRISELAAKEASLNIRIREVSHVIELCAHKPKEISHKYSHNNPSYMLILTHSVSTKNQIYPLWYTHCVCSMVLHCRLLRSLLALSCLPNKRSCPFNFPVQHRIFDSISLWCFRKYIKELWNLKLGLYMNRNCKTSKVLSWKLGRIGQWEIEQ